jgi:hypothetical protein
MARLMITVMAGGGLLLLALTVAGVTQTPGDQPIPQAQEQTIPPDEITPDEVPPAQTVALTADLAKRAIDAFVLVRDKYAESPIYQYETLEEFIEKTEEGKKFEADIKSFGFATVAEWNIAISTVGLTYTSISEGPDYDVAAQIEEIKADMTIAQDMKDRMIASLSSLIPTEHNKQIIADLMKDPIYAEKLKLLAEEE